MKDILQSIDLDMRNPQAFQYFIHVRTYRSPSIVFYDHEIREYQDDNDEYPTMFIITKVDILLFKITLVDIGSFINIIVLVTLEWLNLPPMHLVVSTLTL